jgi:hypothetical protein
MAALLTFSGAALSAADQVPAKMPLWPDKAPDGNGDGVAALRTRA